jgi:Fic family protein
VRTAGDWEGWTAYFLSCVREAADDGVAAATRLFSLLDADRRRLAAHGQATVSAIRLLDALPDHPMVTMQRAMALLGASKPTALKAIQALVAAGILKEVTGRERDRLYAYRAYLAVLGEGAERIVD